MDGEADDVERGAHAIQLRLVLLLGKRRSAASIFLESLEQLLERSAQRAVQVRRPRVAEIFQQG